MYTYYKCYLKVDEEHFSSNSDLNFYPIKDLLKLTTVLWASYYDRETKVMRWVDITSIQNSIDVNLAMYHLTIAMIPADKILLVDPMPSKPIRLDYMEYTDVWTSGYEIRYYGPERIPNHAVRPDIVNSFNYFHVQERNGLYIRRDDLDMKLLAPKCLVSIGGMIHRTSYHDGWLVAKDGKDIMQINDTNCVGLHCFPSKHPIEQVDIKIEPSNTPLRESVTLTPFTIPKNTDKVMLVIAGQLVVPKHGMVLEDNGSVTLSIDKLPYKQWVSDYNNLFNIEGDILSDENIKKVLGGRHSFAIIVKNATDIDTHTETLYPQQELGKYTVCNYPTMPLINGDGYITCYRSRVERGKGWQVLIKNKDNIREKKITNHDQFSISRVGGHEVRWLHVGIR